MCEVYAGNSRALQCFDGCSASPALLGRESTIGACCGFKGRNGGGFLLEGSDICIDCGGFRSMYISALAMMGSQILLLLGCKGLSAISKSVAFRLFTDRELQLLHGGILWPWEG